jgi:hypothetical protein
MDRCEFMVVASASSSALTEGEVAVGFLSLRTNCDMAAARQL